MRLKLKAGVELTSHRNHHGLTLEQFEALRAGREVDVDFDPEIHPKSLLQFVDEVPVRAGRKTEVTDVAAN